LCAAGLAKVDGMPPEDANTGAVPTGSESDPIANTQMFRRFAAQPEPDAPARRRTAQLLIGALVLAVVLAGVLIWLS
jgi:hypothetical protein